jgi:hypothetical protein
MDTASVLTSSLDGGWPGNSLMTATNCLQTVGQSVNLLLVVASKVIPGFSLVEIHDKNFRSFLDVFRNGVSSSKK